MDVPRSRRSCISSRNPSQKILSEGFIRPRLISRTNIIHRFALPQNIVVIHQLLLFQRRKVFRHSVRVLQTVKKPSYIAMFKCSGLLSACRTSQGMRTLSHATFKYSKIHSIIQRYPCMLGPLNPNHSLMEFKITHHPTRRKSQRASAVRTHIDPSHCFLRNFSVAFQRLHLRS